MMMTNDPLETYIGRFQANLPSMTLAERQDIVDEIRSHVHDRVAASGISIPEVLERLGPPEAVAGEYHRGNLVVRERSSLLVLLRIAFAAVVTAFHGMFFMAWGCFGKYPFCPAELPARNANENHETCTSHHSVRPWCVAPSLR